MQQTEFVNCVVQFFIALLILVSACAVITENSTIKVTEVGLSIPPRLPEGPSLLAISLLGKLVLCFSPGTGEKGGVSVGPFVQWQPKTGESRGLGTTQSIM